MSTPLEIAEKLTEMAGKTLRPLERQIATWPDEFRAIVWQAVAETANRLAAEAASPRPTPTQGDRG